MQQFSAVLKMFYGCFFFLYVEMMHTEIVRIKAIKGRT